MSKDKSPAASLKGKNLQLVFHNEAEFVCISILQKGKQLDRIHLTREQYLQLSTMIYKTCFPELKPEFKLDLIKP